MLSIRVITAEGHRAVAWRAAEEIPQPLSSWPLMFCQHLKQAQVMLSAGVQAPRQRKKGKEWTWRGNGHHTLHSSLLNRKKQMAVKRLAQLLPIASTACTPILAVITHDALFFWHEHCPLLCSPVPSSSRPGKEFDYPLSS